MRMALDLGLHRALEKLADDSGKQRTEEEERNLGNVSPYQVDTLLNWHISCFSSYLALSLLV